MCSDGAQNVLHLTTILIVIAKLSNLKQLLSFESLHRISCPNVDLYIIFCPIFVLEFPSKNFIILLGHTNYLNFRKIYF